MKAQALAIAGLTAFASLASTSAAAAGGTSLSGLISRFTGPFEEIKFPVAGNLGNASIGSLPVLGTLNLPLFGKGLPVVSSLTVHDGIVVLQSLDLLQGHLAGK